MMTIWTWLAMAPPPQPGMEPNPKAQMLQLIGMFVIMGVMFYFLLIRPQAKQRKEHEQMLRSLRSGDHILTSGGLYGIVTNVKEKSLMVKIADNVKVEIAKSAVTSVLKRGEESAEEKEKPKEKK